MKSLKLITSGLLLYGVTLGGAPAWGAEGIILKQVVDSVTNYCHLKFPRIREETLNWEQPVLKDPSEGDIVDFYGSCDHDPAGEAEVRRQKMDRYRERGFFGED